MANLFHRLLHWDQKATLETVDAERYAEAFGQFKKLLLEQYQRRLQTKTARRLPINLSAKPTHYGTSPERAALYFDDQTIESEDIVTEIDKILDAHKRLLIIGDPGAGKTMILLFAAVNILQQKEPKLPLLLNLATWNSADSFKRWYAQSIADTYGLSKAFVAELLARNAIVPFFDGYDEVAETVREDCFKKMGLYFGDERNRQLIICSRRKEYAEAKADAPVYAEIEVQPLTLAQIQKALFENGQSYKSDLALMHALDKDPHLAKAVETPFYLNTASFLFSKGERTVYDFAFSADNAEGRQKELVQTFVNEQVLEEKDRKYLGFLAQKMNADNFLVFELVKMQPGWATRKWLWRLLLGFLIGAILGWIFVSCGLLVFTASLNASFETPNLSIFDEMTYQTLLDDASGGIAGARYLSVFFSLLFVLFPVIIRPTITTNDVQIWRWSIFIQNLRSIGLYLLIFITSGFAVGFLISMIFFYNDFNYHTVYENFEGAAGGSIPGVTIGFLFGLTYGIRQAGISTRNFLYIPKPYQRFRGAFRHFSWISYSLIFIVLIFIFNPLTGSPEGIKNISIWIYIIFIGLNTLLLPVIPSKFLHHFILRFVLFLEGKFPLRVVTFMDRMSDQYIFEDNRRIVNGKKQRGATWRFRHKILQDYFADKSS